MKLVAAFCSLVVVQLVYVQLAEAQLEMLMDVIAPYNVTKNGEGYEERYYPPARWICHKKLNTRPTMSRLPESFSSLFDYIMGANKEGEKVPIGRPLTMIMKQKETTGKWMTQMCFYLPEGQEVDSPMPNDDDVYVENRPAMTVFVRQMGGHLTSEEEWESQAMLLEQTLQDKEPADFSTYYLAEFDPPTKREKRRNEVWFMKKDTM